MPELHATNAYKSKFCEYSRSQVNTTVVCSSWTIDSWSVEQDPAENERIGEDKKSFMDVLCVNFQCNSRVSDNVNINITRFTSFY